MKMFFFLSLSFVLIYLYVRLTFACHALERLQIAKNRYYLTHKNDLPVQDIELVSWLEADDNYKNNFEIFFKFWCWDDTAIVNDGLYSIIKEYYPG